MEHPQVETYDSRDAPLEKKERLPKKRVFWSWRDPIGSTTFHRERDKLRLQAKGQKHFKVQIYPRVPGRPGRMVSQLPSCLLTIKVGFLLCAGNACAYLQKYAPTMFARMKDLQDIPISNGENRAFLSHIPEDKPVRARVFCLSRMVKGLEACWCASFGAKIVLPHMPLKDTNSTHMYIYIHNISIYT